MPYIRQIVKSATPKVGYIQQFEELQGHFVAYIDQSSSSRAVSLHTFLKIGARRPFRSIRSTIPELSKLWVLLLALTEHSCGMLRFLGWSVCACLKTGTRAPWRLKHASGTAFAAFFFDTH